MSQTPDPLEQIRICYMRLPQNVALPPTNLSNAAHSRSGPLQLAVGKDKFWKVGTVLKVSWWGREKSPVSQKLKDRVMNVTKQWTDICNISLDFGNHGNEAQIRVAFVPGGGSWSYVGKDCLLDSITKDEPTMNFGWLDDDSSDDLVREVVLHEFGHALGCVHEHQNPDVTIRWNEPAVYEAFSAPPNSWSRDQIEHNIIKPTETSMNSAFDPDSIMLYYYPPNLTLDGKGTHANNQLSVMDKAYIRKLYPPQGRADGFFDSSQLAGAVSTVSPPDVSNAPTPGPFNTKMVMFDPPYTGAPPKMAIGLSRIDMSCKANKAVAATLENVKKESAIVSISTWDTSILNGGAAQWVEAEATDEQWQFGEFNTQDQRDRNDTSSQTAEKTIYFDTPYKSPPTIVAALKLVDLENNRDWRVKTYATDIHEDRFTLHIDTWDDSILYAAAATWIAYPSDLSSAFSTTLTSALDKRRTEERLKFPSGKFVKKPTVRTFLNLIDVRCGTDLRIKAFSDQINKDALTWHAETWQDTKLRQAGVSILAWQ